MRRILTLGHGSLSQMYRSQENGDHSTHSMHSPAIDGKAETKMSVWNGWRVVIVCLMVIETVAASTLKRSNGAIKASQRGTYFQPRPGAALRGHILARRLLSGGGRPVRSERNCCE